MPWVTPGTPLGNTGWRSPGSFFFESNNENVSMESQPASMPPSGSRRSINATPRALRIAIASSALAAVARERQEHFDALTQLRRRLLIAPDLRRPLAHGRGVAPLPRPEGGQLARAVAERRARRRDRLEPPGHLGERRAVEEQHGGADGGEILERLAARRVRRDVVIGGDRRLGVARGELGRLAQ